jgi:hypothetical protein
MANSKDIGKSVLVLTKTDKNEKGESWENMGFYIIGVTPDKTIVRRDQDKANIALENGYVRIIDKF